LKDHTGHIRTFDLDKMIEILHGNNPNTSPIPIKIERRDFKSKQMPLSFDFVSFYSQQILNQPIFHHIGHP
jgi:hypothetical protein